MAAIDVAGYVTELKDHAVDHGFHVHDERHFVETYSLRQVWEVDLHPEEGCNGPLDLHLTLEVEPRILLAFEDVVAEHPAVAQVGVIGTPHEKFGEAVTAIVVLRSDAATDEASIATMTAEIQEMVKERKGSVQAPKQVIVADSLPLTGLGKPDKKALRARYWTGDRAVG